MRPSVVEPLSAAFERTLRILFRPFDLTKWLTLGLAAFLISLGNCSGGGGGGGNTGFQFQGDRSYRRDVERAFRDATDWAGEHLALILVLGSIVALIVLCVWLLFVWLSSRGQFLLLDGVVRDRAAVVEPWGEYRREGNSLFRFAAVFQGLFGVLVICAVGVALLLAWNDLDRGRFEVGSVVALVLGGGLVLLLSVGGALVGMLLADFVVPAMYARRLNVMAAWRVTLDEVLRPHLGAVVLYVLMRIAIAVVLGVVTLGLLCGTLGLACCLLMIPYVGSVVLLPITVFKRTYSLEFLEQLGPAWTLRSPGAASPAAR